MCVCGGGVAGGASEKQLKGDTREDTETDLSLTMLSHIGEAKKKENTWLAKLRELLPLPYRSPYPVQD